MDLFQPLLFNGENCRSRRVSSSQENSEHSGSLRSRKAEPNIEDLMKFILGEGKLQRQRNGKYEHYQKKEENTMWVIRGKS